MRISRAHMFMNMAEVAAMRSTCQRGNIGAIIVKHNDIVCMGYNGPPSGEDHCQGNDCKLTASGGCLRSIHAEANAVARAINKLSDLNDCDLYCTYSPCQPCAFMIAQAKIGRFFYRYSYRDPSGLEYLQLKLHVFRVTSAGYVINQHNQVVI